MLGVGHACGPMSNPSKPGSDHWRRRSSWEESPLAVPQWRSKSPRKLRPSATPRLESQKCENQQGHPHLPPRGVGVVPEAVGQLKVLLDLFEGDLDLPAASVLFFPTLPVGSLPLPAEHCCAQPWAGCGSGSLAGAWLW